MTVLQDIQEGVTEDSRPTFVSCRGPYSGLLEMMVPSALLTLAHPFGSSPLIKAQFTGTLLSG